MEFDKVRYDGANVELLYKEALEPSGHRDSADHGKDPTPAFKAALQAFSGYVAWVHQWPETIVDRIEIRQVTIKRPDDAPRGITVTALLKCPRAHNSTSTVNTPYLSEPPADYSGDRKGFLPESTVALINELEARAKEYHDGERGEQTALPLGDSANTKAANERMASAEVASTRAPKGRGSKKGKDFIPGVGDVANPDATEPLTDDNLRQLLLSVERDIPIDAISAWASTERDDAARWAMATQKLHIGEIKKSDVPKEPACVKRNATLPLKADEWTGDPPPKAGAVSTLAGRAD